MIKSTEKIEIEAEKEFEKIVFKLDSRGIMNIILKNSVKLFTVEDLQETMEWIASLGERKYLNLYEGNFSIVDTLVREKAASTDENKYTIADAFLVKNTSDNMMGDFYLQFNKPCKPTKSFDNRDEAIEWLLSFKD